MTKKNKAERGRPEIAEKDRRKVLMQFRVTEAEARRLRANAEKAGVSVSDWLRIRAFDEA